MKLKQWRKKHNLTQIELAHKLGIRTKMTVSAWENGHAMPQKTQRDNLDALIRELEDFPFSWIELFK